MIGLGTVINKRTVQQCYSGPVALIYLCISTHSWDALPCQLPGSHRSALLLLDYILGIFSHFQNFATHYWWKSRKGKTVISPPAWTNSNVYNNKLLGKAADSNTKELKLIYACENYGFQEFRWRVSPWCVSVFCGSVTIEATSNSK